MKKLKNGNKAKIHELKKEMLRAMKGHRHDEVIALGEELAALYGDKSAPAELYFDIGEAYVNKITADENFWRKPYAEQMRLKKAAFPYWDKAYAAGLLTSPEEIMYYVSLGSEKFMHLHRKMYEVIKDVFAKIKGGVYKKPSPLIMGLYYENFVTCAMALGYHAEAFEAGRECWLTERDAEKRSERYGALLLVAQYLDFSAADLFDLHKVYNGFFKDIVPHTYDLAALAAGVFGWGMCRRIVGDTLPPNFLRGCCGMPIAKNLPSICTALPICPMP